MTLLREMPPTEGEAVEDICRALARLVGFRASRSAERTRRARRARTGQARVAPVRGPLVSNELVESRPFADGSRHI